MWSHVLCLQRVCLICAVLVMRATHKCYLVSCEHTTAVLSPTQGFKLVRKWLQSSHCQSKGGTGCKQHGVLVMARLACVWQDKKHFMYCNRNIFLPCVFKQPHLLFHHVIPHWYSDSLFALCSLGHAHIEDDFCFTRRQGVTSTVWRGDQAASQCRWWLASCPDLPWGWVRQTSRQDDKQTD